VNLLGAAATRSKPTEAIDARITEGLDTDYDLYKVINKRPGYSIYELAKLMGWSKKDMRGGRSILKVQAADWSEFFTKVGLEEFDNLEF
jgi:hypothetical protein